MQELTIHNPFGAPVYHADTVDSTMNVSRTLAQQGKPHGTVISADFQEEGRGRIKGRVWETEKGANLAFTILLRFPDIEHIPQALTLRTGLAVSLAIEDFAPVLSGRVKIKWPNDILITPSEQKTKAAKAQTSCKAQAAVQAATKAAGILAEADGGNVHIGMGINVAQKLFPDTLRDKATSISLATGMEITNEERFTLLEKILMRLHTELESTNWRERIEMRLYQKGQQINFAEGAADSGKIVSGILAGIGPGGELMIARGEGVRAFVTGEMVSPEA
jgi:BirA family biotin operon repressor/biotin-[acetyl-CoA-carboxylase] ligase